MNNKIFIFTENLKTLSGAKLFKQKFNGVCCGHQLKNLHLKFLDEEVNLAIGYYIFKIEVEKIESKTLFGKIITYKFFSE